MIIKMLNQQLVAASYEGIETKLLKKNQYYTVPYEISNEIAEVMLENKHAVEVEEKEIKETGTKEIKDEEIEVIDIDEDEEIESKKKNKSDIANKIKRGFNRRRR